MGSNVLEKTDYSNYEPLNKKETAKKDTLGKYSYNPPPKQNTEVKQQHDPRNAKQNFLQSALDQPRSFVAP